MFRLFKWLLSKYKEKEAKIMFALKSKYSSEKIEQAEKELGRLCTFLVILNAFMIMVNVQVFATEIIEENIKNSVLEVVIDEDDNKETKEITTDTIDDFSQKISELNKKDDIEENTKNSYITKRLIVLSDTSEFDNYGAESVVNYDNMHVLQYDTESKTRDAYEKLTNSEEIEAVEIDSVMETESEENNNETTTWEEKDTELRQYLDSKEAKREVIAAVLDTGLNADNDIFNDRIIDTNINLSATGQENSIADDNGHGTQIAELIAMNSNNNVKIMPIKVSNNKGKATILNVYLGLKKAIEHNANVINISMNTVVSNQSKILEKAITEAKGQGVLVVVSAGNDGSDVKNYTPSSINDAIVVSAVNKDNSFANYSNYGKTIDYSTYGDYNGKSGTSYAAASFTGIAADFLSKNENIEELNKYAVDLGDKGFDDYFGNGFIGLKIMENSNNDNGDNTDDKEHGEDNGNNGDQNDNNNDEIKKEDKIPPDYFEEEIFGTHWKNLSDEDIVQKLEEAEEAKLAIFLQSLSEDDLQLLLSKQSILNNDYITYGYSKDENGNLIVENEEIDENGEVNYTYKIEETLSVPYYEYLLKLDFSEMNISANKELNGSFDLTITGGGKAESTITINVKVKSENIDASPHDVEFSINKSSKNNHDFSLINARKTTLQGSTTTEASGVKDDYYIDENNKKHWKTKKYCIVSVGGQYTQPAYTYAKGSQEAPNDSQRFNFEQYSWKNDGDYSLENAKIVQNENRTEKFNMQVNVLNAGIDYSNNVSGNGKMKIELINPTLTIKYDKNGATSGRTEGVETTIKYNNKAELEKFSSMSFLSLSKTGYLRRDGAEWNTKADGSGKSFDQDKAYSAVEYDTNFPNKTKFTNRNMTVYAQWTPITYYVRYDGNGATSGSTSQSTHIYDKPDKLTANGFSRAYTVTYNHNYTGSTNSSATANYQFAHWLETGLNVTGGTFGNQATVKNLTEGNGDVVKMTAQWNPASVTLPTPSRTGYIFNGWYDAAIRRK